MIYQAALVFRKRHHLRSLVYQLLGLLVEDLTDLIELRDPHLSSYRIGFIQGVLCIYHLLFEADHVYVEFGLPVGTKPYASVFRLWHDTRISHELVTVEVAVVRRLGVVEDLRR